MISAKSKRGNINLLNNLDSSIVARVERNGTELGASAKLPCAYFPRFFFRVQIGDENRRLPSSNLVREKTLGTRLYK